MARRDDAHKPAIETLDGKTTLDQAMDFEPERLGYRSADRIAEGIADAVLNCWARASGQRAPTMVW